MPNYLANVAGTLLGMGTADLDAVAKLLWRCWRSDRRLFVAGNGGSSATASHMCVDLSKGLFVETGKGIDTFCLTDNVPTLTAWANDSRYDLALAQQLLCRGCEMDYLLVISGSGNSQNILSAVETAQQMGMTTITLTGMGGGKLSAMACAHTVIVPSDSMQVCEDAHSVFAHGLYCALRDRAKAERE